MGDDIAPLESAAVEWVDGVPFSRRYGDVYYSRAGGQEEARAVFLAGNGLPQRCSGRRRFAIGEIGFGTGLNFLATLAAWNESSSKGFLSYWAVEHAPLNSSVIREASSRWPELKCYADELIRIYPKQLTRGWYRRHLCGGTVALTLVFDDAATSLEQLDGRVDAWYLDGFAPTNNPTAWSHDVMFHLRRLSNVGTTFSTYTAAGAVRRALQAVGFEVRKAAGFGGKRERIHGELCNRGEENTPPQPWFDLTSSVVGGNRIAVIGAGIAGVSAARRLCQAGYDVTLVEKQQSLGSMASGNPAAVVSPGRNGDSSIQALILRHAFDFTSTWFDQFKNSHVDFPWYASGMMVMNGPDDRSFPEGAVEMTAEKVYAQTGIKVDRSVHWYPNAGWLAPQPLLNALLRQSERVTRLQLDVCSLQPQDGQWLLRNERGNPVVRADAVVLATGTSDLLGSFPSWMPITNVRGQVTTVTPCDAFEPPLRYVVAGRRYVIPGPGSSLSIGATFQPNDTCTDRRPSDDLENVHVFSTLWPGRNLPQVYSGRAAIRAASPDYCPYVGPVPHLNSYFDAYSSIKFGNQRSLFARAPYQAGLFVMLGFGSRGFTLAPFAAEFLADVMSGLPALATRRILHRLHPARALIRNLRRGATHESLLRAKS